VTTILWCVPVTTPKARRLGAALKEARLERGFGVRQLAEQVGKDHSLISRYESGERVPKLEDVAAILATLGINGDQRDEILSLARGTDQPRWLAVTLPEQRQQLAALLELERTATSIVDVSPLLITGFLQTTKYIRAIMTGGGVPTDEIETRVAVRIGRRETITQDTSVQLVALLGEAALRQEVGGRSVMVEQLRHLLKMAERPNVDLRVTPFTAGWYPALEGPFTVIESADTTQVVHLENRRSGLFLHEPEDVDLYRGAIEAVREVAMSPGDSAGLIADVIREKETTQ
jgi:transcriptional regulator with XRE-family HTH domain